MSSLGSIEEGNEEKVGKEKEGKEKGIEKEGKEREEKEKEEKNDKWECKMCKTKNNEKIFCGKCFYIQKKLTKRIDIVVPITIAEWKCNNCNKENNNKIFCNNCFTLVQDFVDKIKSASQYSGSEQLDNESSDNTPSPGGLSDMQDLKL